ncbi:hypothetical protein Afil01_30620 [Actinorhabdospora filicis]|uniref:DUF4262 domain-containing protein n=1 Tax=Actinorhabdospora filicis TaxID=1785913 RepID=A0A9W6SLS6_9ACTN|nr:hypothetical protein [Actinorhabdospora filicis]GLZ78255.1 hypothetical protein Afil01_30620 [Actinorhabdospora filicis]
MSHEVHFDSRTSARAVQEVLCARHGIDPALFYVGDLADYTGPRLIAYTTPAPAGDPYFACLLGGGPEFAAAIGGITELQLATQVCEELGTRAIVDDGGEAYSVWTLVTADGLHGRVVVDVDRLADGDFAILHAYQPISSEPGIPVVEPPAWQSGWYPNGDIPT